MNLKKCITCLRTSYRAHIPEKWLCPYCGTDLNEIQAQKVDVNAKKKKGYFKFLKE